MKKLFLNIYSFFKVSWVNTIIVNFTKLPFKQALKIPILLYGAKVNFRGGGENLVCCFRYFVRNDKVGN